MERSFAMSANINGFTVKRLAGHKLLYFNSTALGIMEDDGFTAFEGFSKEKLEKVLSRFPEDEHPLIEKNGPWTVKVLVSQLSRLETLEDITKDICKSGMDVVVAQNNDALGFAMVPPEVSTGTLKVLMKAREPRLDVDRCLLTRVSSGKDLCYSYLSITEDALRS